MPLEQDTAERLDQEEKHRRSPHTGKLRSTILSFSVSDNKSAVQDLQPDARVGVEVGLETGNEENGMELSDAPRCEGNDGLVREGAGPAGVVLIVLGRCRR